MKAHVIDTHLLMSRSRSSAKVKVKYQGHVSQKIGVSGALVFHKHILFLGWSKYMVVWLKFNDSFFFFNVLIFSSAVFGENPSYCYSLCVFLVVQKLTFCNISAITEDNNLKLGGCAHYPRSNTSKSRQPRVGTRMQFLLFFFSFFS